MIKNNFSSNALNSVYNSIEYLTTFFDNDIEIIMTDLNEVLYYQGSKEINAHIKVGDAAGKFVKDAMSKGVVEIKKIPEDFIGVAFKSYMIPIKDGNKVVGSIAIGKSLSKKVSVGNITKEVIESLLHIEKSITDLSTGVFDLTNMNNLILSESNSAHSMAKNTDSIIEFIKSISYQTKLLGLNASIEAARAGELGSGFSVVAKEIIKLSHSSKDSVSEIDEVIKNITESISKINNKVNTADSISNKQASAIKEIVSSIEKLNITAKHLGELADKL